MPYYVAVGLTSESVRGILHSYMNDKELDEFFSENSVNEKIRQLLLSSIDEAKCNRFGLFVLDSKMAMKGQLDILQELWINS